MKKTILLLSLLILTITSCSGEKYKEYAVRPIPATLKVSPGDESFIALKIEVPAGKYIYANPKGPGVGKATEIKISEVKGIISGSPKYLSGKKYQSPDDKDHVFIYKNETYIFVPFNIPEDAKTGGDVLLPITVEALICDDSTCLPKSDVIKYTVTVDSAAEKFFHQADIVSMYSRSVSTDPVSQIISGSTPADDLTDSGTISYSSFKPRYAEQSITGIIQAVIFGIIAGFILNFMPCVLPVVSLKVMSFVKHAGADSRELKILGLLFSAGILVSFGVLAALAAFFGYNWGGLFQHRAFILVMTGIVLALMLSMFGVFTLNIPSFAGKAAGSGNENPRIDAFVKGLFATLLATPCSGPFLGGTLAWTLAQPSHIIFIVFMSIGFGMALPYSLLTLNPKFIRFIPKPGNWMKLFEHGMAFLLLFTVVYLISVLDSESKVPALFFLSFTAVGFYQYGKFGSIISSGLSRAVSSAVLILFIAGGYYLSFHAFSGDKSFTSIEAVEYSEEKLTAASADGKIVIVKFTADWCPNCKYVEKRSLDTADVSAEIRARGALLLKADITRTNPPAERLLKSLGSYSIPVLAVIAPGEKFYSPVVLRDIYSEDDVLKALDDAVDIIEEK
jgi:thiol:disulfide interchange protein DsbD